MEQSKILIVGANGAMGSFALLKMFGNENLSVLILPSEQQGFIKDKVMHEDEWHPGDTTVIKKSAFVVGREPSSRDEVGVFTTESIPAGFFDKNGIVVITSKIFHYESVIDSIKHTLNKNTLLLILVNGLNPELSLERICRKKGLTNPVVRAVVMGGTHYTIDAEKFSVHSGVAKFVIGHWKKEMSASWKNMLEKIASVFPREKFVVEPQYGVDYRTLCFDKVLANLVNPVSAFTGCPTIEYVEYDLVRDLITRCFNQGIDVGLSIGLKLSDRSNVISRKLEMYEKAGRTSKAHLPSMGQDSMRSILSRGILYHENDHIGVAVVNEGREAKKPYNAAYIDGFNTILAKVTDYYNTVYKGDKDKAALFLLELMMRNRYSLGLNPNNSPLYDQFRGLDELESRIHIDYAKVKRILSIDEAASVFEENLAAAKQS